jgi:glycerophosphoryl diester phosphodiesterase
MNKLPAIFAHRGARLVAPENTLPAFAAALEMGADGIELDIHATRDGKLAVIHDFTLEHTTNGVGRVADHTMNELVRLDAGSHFHPGFAGVPIPTLEEALDLVGNRCTLNIEIKSDAGMGGDAPEPLVDLLRWRNLHDRVIVSSFNVMSLFHMRWLDDKVRLGLLFYEPLPRFVREPWLLPLIRPEALHPHYSLVDEPFMAWARQQGFAVNVWTVNEIDEARRLAALGVDAIITDAPDVIRAGLLVEE